MINIAIDGPSGAGKSTVAKILAERLKILYLDTGAMYRAVGLKALRSGISPGDAVAVEPILPFTVVEIKYVNGEQRVFLDGWDVSGAIREHAVSKAASDISAIPAVRIKLVELQREIAAKNDCVLDGRDIGTYVLPDASHKFFMTASAETRARRRFKELLEKGQDVSYQQILDDIILRDKNDSTRAFAPLKKADDAVEIDTTDISAEQAAEMIIGKVTNVL